MASAKRFARSLIKILLIALVVFMTIAFLILKWMERSPAQLKVGLESYLTQVAGYPADIGALKKISFVPTMMVDVEDVRLWALDNPDRIMIGVKSATMSMPFWSAMIGGSRFSVFSVEGVVVDQDVSGIAPITIDTVHIDTDASELNVAGKIGDLSISGAVPLEKGGRNFRPKTPPSRIAFDLNGPNTQGTVFADINKDQYGVTADFTRYAAQDLRPLQQILERVLDAQDISGALTARLNIGRLENTDGSFDIPAMDFSNGALQPVECFYNNRGQAGKRPHPCAQYFQEPDTDNMP